MKRGAPGHPKMLDLAEALGEPRYAAIGLVEALFHFTAQYAPRGDVGRRSNRSIAESCFWVRPADDLIAGLVLTGWLAEHAEFRLVLPGWPRHCDNTVRQYLRRNRLNFWDGTEPKSTKDLDGGAAYGPAQGGLFDDRACVDSVEASSSSAVALALTTSSSSHPLVTGSTDEEDEEVQKAVSNGMRTARKARSWGTGEAFADPELITGGCLAVRHALGLAGAAAADPGWTAWLMAHDGVPPVPRDRERPQCLEDLGDLGALHGADVLALAIRMARARMKLFSLSRFLNPDFCGPHITQARKKLVPPVKVLPTPEAKAPAIAEPSSEQLQIFQGMKARLIQSSAGEAQKFFQEIELKGLHEGKVFVSTRSRYVKSWIENHYMAELTAAAALFGPGTGVGLVVDPAHQATT